MSGAPVPRVGLRLELQRAMARLHDVYKRLQSMDDATVDRAMAAALPTADPVAQRLIAMSLLERGQIEGNTALVHFFDQFPPDIQQAILQRADGWDGPLRQVASSRTTRGPANVVRIIVAAKAAHLAYLITQQLHYRPPDLMIESAKGLLALAEWVSSQTQHHQGVPSSSHASAARYVRQAVQEAVSCYHAHKQPAVLLALAALAPQPLPIVMRRFHDSRDLAITAMRQILSHPDQAHICRAMLVMIQAPALVEAVLQGLAVVGSDVQLAEVLRQWHLLLIARVRRALQKFDGPQQLWPISATLEGWSAHATRGLARWAMTLDLSPHQRVNDLGQLLTLPDPMARLAALRQLIHLSIRSSQQADVNQLIAGSVKDPEAKLAWIALRYLISCNWPGLWALLPGLINSPHHDIAQLARHRLAAIGFARLWGQWPQMPREKRLALGRAIVKMGVDFRHQLVTRLASSSGATRLRALSIVDELGQAQTFEANLIALAGDSDEKTASAAVRVLGSLVSRPVEDILIASLRHADSRVRANAIEALQRQASSRHKPQIESMAHQEQNRPRANAVRALLQMNAKGATHALARMLEDPSPAQRHSALWVVQAMGVVAGASQVAEMAVTDPDSRVKSRADQVIHGLIDLMHRAVAGAQSELVSA